MRMQHFAWLSLVLFLVGCGPKIVSKNAGKLEGTKWVSKAYTINGRFVAEGDMKLDFRDDGALVLWTGDVRNDGTYSLGKDHAVQLNFEQLVAGRRTISENIIIEDNAIRVTGLNADESAVTFVRTDSFVAQVKDNTPIAPPPVADPIPPLPPVKQKEPDPIPDPAPPPPPPIKIKPKPDPDPMPTPQGRKPINAMTAHWAFEKFDANLMMQDASGRNNHGKIYNPQGMKGVKGFALLFGGNTNQFFDMGDSKDFDYEADWDFTYCGWFKTARTQGAILVQRNKPGEGTSGGIYIRIAAGRLSVNVHNDQGHANFILSREAVHNNLWHHFALVRHGSELHLVLDGQLIKTEKIAFGKSAITTKYRHIGSDRVAIDQGQRNDSTTFVGAIDEVRIYQRALAFQEIQKLASKP